MTKHHWRTNVGPFDETEPRVLAALSGVVTGLTGVVAYFVVPLVTADYGPTGGLRDTADVTNYVLTYFFAQSLLYHAGALVLVPFVTTAVALTVVRRTGGGRWTDAAVVTAVVVGPVVAIWLGASVALVAIAFQAPAIALFGVPFAAVIATVLSAIVTIVVTVSAVCGYALVESVGPQPPE